MDRLLRVCVAGIVIALVLVIGTRLLLRHERRETQSTAAPTPARTSAPTVPATEDPCAQSVILTLRSHSGVSAQMSLQNMDGQDQATQDTSADDGRFTTECQRLENDGPSGDSSPQVVRLCKPGTFIVHIAGSGKGVFDFQAKALPDVTHPISPLLLCNYALDNDRTYDWVLKYQGGSKPAVFLLGSKGDPSLLH